MERTLSAVRAQKAEDGTPPPPTTGPWEARTAVGGIAELLVPSTVAAVSVWPMSVAGIDVPSDWTSRSGTVREPPVGSLEEELGTLLASAFYGSMRIHALGADRQVIHDLAAGGASMKPGVRAQLAGRLARALAKAPDAEQRRLGMTGAIEESIASGEVATVMAWLIHRAPVAASR